MSRLSELILKWDELRASGKIVDAKTLCPDDKELEARLAEEIRLITASENLFGMMAGPAEASQPAFPAMIGRYIIRKELGNGGMGVVYLGWDTDLHRLVAIKRILPQYDDARLVERFLRERRVIGHLDHPNIVSVYDSGVHLDQPYLVMKYIEGGTLALHNKRFSNKNPQAIVELLRKISLAVAHAHGRDILHRDIKPNNILLSETNEPFIADFGLAKWATRDPLELELANTKAQADTNPEIQALTNEGNHPGTPKYMAPEHRDSTYGVVTAASDVWSIGVVGYELMTGRNPFPNGYSAPYVSAGNNPLGKLIDRCLRLQPSERFRSAKELSDALENASKKKARIGLAISSVIAIAIVTWICVYLFPFNVVEENPSLRLVDSFPTVKTGFDPDFVSRCYRDLSDGKVVTLVEDQKLPHYRILFPNVGKGLFKEGAGFRVEANRYCLTELLPGLPEGRWQIDAELQQIGESTVNSSGVAVAIRRECKDAIWHSQAVTADFRDQLKPQPSCVGTIRLIQHWESNRESWPGKESLFLNGSKPIPTRGFTTHTIRVWIDSTSWTANIDGVQMPQIDADAIATTVPTMIGDPTTLSGGVGLFVKDGTTRVHRFSVRKAPQ